MNHFQESHIRIGENYFENKNVLLFSQVNHNKCSSEYNINIQEFELLKTQLREKEILIENLNFQISKSKQEYMKVSSDKESINLELLEIKQNLNKTKNESINTISYLKDKILHLEEDNFNLKNEINQKNFKLTEITLNYEKLKNIYEGLKIANHKLNNDFIDLNKENFRLRTSNINKNGSSATKNSIITGCKAENKICSESIEDIISQNTNNQSNVFAPRNNLETISNCTYSISDIASDKLTILSDKEQINKNLIDYSTTKNFKLDIAMNIPQTPKINQYEDPKKFIDLSIPEKEIATKSDKKTNLSYIDDSDKSIEIVDNQNLNKKKLKTICHKIENNLNLKSKNLHSINNERKDLKNNNINLGIRFINKFKIESPENKPNNNIEQSIQNFRNDKHKLQIKNSEKNLIETSRPVTGVSKNFKEKESEKSNVEVSTHKNKPDNPNLFKENDNFDSRINYKSNKSIIDQNAILKNNFCEALKPPFYKKSHSSSINNKQEKSKIIHNEFSHPKNINENNNIHNNKFIFNTSTIKKSFRPDKNSIFHQKQNKFKTINVTNSRGNLFEKNEGFYAMTRNPIYDSYIKQDKTNTKRVLNSSDFQSNSRKNVVSNTNSSNKLDIMRKKNYSTSKNKRNMNIYSNFNFNDLDLLNNSIDISISKDIRSDKRFKTLNICNRQFKNLILKKSTSKKLINSDSTTSLALDKTRSNITSKSFILGKNSDNKIRIVDKSHISNYEKIYFFSNFDEYYSNPISKENKL